MQNKIKIINCVVYLMRNPLNCFSTLINREHSFWLKTVTTRYPRRILGPCIKFLVLYCSSHTTSLRVNVVSDFTPHLFTRNSLHSLLERSRKGGWWKNKSWRPEPDIDKRMTKFPTPPYRDKTYVFPSEKQPKL